MNKEKVNLYSRNKGIYIIVWREKKLPKEPLDSNYRTIQESDNIEYVSLVGYVIHNKKPNNFCHVVLSY